MNIGDTPVQLGLIEAADAMIIDGKIVTRDDYRALVAQVAALKDAINKCTVDGVALLRLSPELKQLVAATPQHHLATIEAQILEREAAAIMRAPFEQPLTLTAEQLAVFRRIADDMRARAAALRNGSDV